VTAAAIAKEAGVDDFIAQATPEDKLARIPKRQTAGHLVAMTGDAPTMLLPWPRRNVGWL